MTEHLDRLKQYSGQLVAVQLRTSYCMLSYAGSAMIDGTEQHGLVPLTMPGPDGRPQIAGFSQIIPTAILEVRDLDVLLRYRDPATNAEIHMSVPADEILYVMTVKPPSKLIT